MSFQVEGKVGLISGGASGIGLCCAKELLRNGLKGVTIADVNEELGGKALREIDEEFGVEKAIFVATDVTKKESYEGVFRKTVERFGNLDIVINNAGIFDDSIWEKEIQININGVINGVLLGMEDYLQKWRTADDAVIVNTSSIAGLEGVPCSPVYVATKFAIVGLSVAFGGHYDRTKVKVIALCPGITATPLLVGFREKVLDPAYGTVLATFLEETERYPVQKPEDVARGLVEIIGKTKSGSVWVVEGGNEPYEFVMPPRQSFAPK